MKVKKKYPSAVICIYERRGKRRIKIYPRENMTILELKN